MMDMRKPEKVKERLSDRLAKAILEFETARKAAGEFKAVGYHDKDIRLFIVKLKQKRRHRFRCIVIKIPCRFITEQHAGAIY